MKSIALLSLFAAAGLAQDMGGISDCGKMCINNMLDLAPELGCEAKDMACLCANMDFGYGVRDCATEACPGDDLEKIQSVGAAQCPGGGDSPTGGNGGGSGGSKTDGSTGKPTGGSGDGDDNTTGGPEPTGTETANPTGGSQTTMMTESMPTGTMTETDGAGGSETASPTDGSGDGSGGSGGSEDGSEDGSGSGSETGTGTATTGSEGVAARTAVPGIAGALGLMAVLVA